MKTIKQILAAAGWTTTVGTVSGISGKPGLWVQPARKGTGEPIALSAVLPAGARIVIGENSGTVEYDPKSRGGYARIAAGLDFDSPFAVIRDLIDADAQIEV